MSTNRPARLTHRSATAVIVALIAAIALPQLASAAVPGDTLGVYAGAGKPSAVAAFETQIGRPVAMVHDALARENWANLTDPTWFSQQWSASAYRQRVIYSVPMLPDSGGTLAEGAAGAYNAYFRTLALRLVAGGDGAAILRIGPEFNGNWFRWSITAANGGTDYAAFWRQIVTTMRAVPGANFKFDWCPNGGSSWVNGQQLQAESAYPGDAFVDYIGLDVYDQSWAPHRGDPAARWREFLNQRNGLSWHRAFAAQRGKPMTFPEWGLANRSDGYGGGDSPYFIEQMYDWIRTNDVAYHMYFQYADSNADYSLFSSWAPNASRRFVELFGAASTGTVDAPPAAPGSTDPAPTPAPAAPADNGEPLASAGPRPPAPDDPPEAPAISSPPAGSPPPTSPAPRAGAPALTAPAKSSTKRAKARRCPKTTRRARAARRTPRICSTQRARGTRARGAKVIRKGSTQPKKPRPARR